MDRLSVAAEGPLIQIVSFLGEPDLGGSKKLQFTQLICDHIFLLTLKQMNLPLFPFLKNLSIAYINKDLGLEVEFDRIKGIFKQIHDTAKRSITRDQFTAICTQYQSRNISRYKAMNVSNNQNQDRAICVLAKALRNQIPQIPQEPGAIRVWFANPSSKAAFNEVTELDLASKDLKCVPPEIGNLKKLQLLALSGNNLSELPSQIGSLINLDQLFLSNNKLSKLPGNFSNLRGLNELYLLNNNIFELPTGIGNLINLQSLELSDNYLFKLPAEIVHFLSNYNLSIGPQKITELERETPAGDDLSDGGEFKRLRK